ncbi:TOMM precursor leader peptide-binding protein [Rhizobium sullae]|nr:TOMM precursor leader peptide-binding protein [Rhizobium sullae]
MSYRLDEAVQIYRGRHQREFLVISPGRTLRLPAVNPVIGDLVDGLLSDALSAEILKRVADDAEASALIDEFVKTGILIDVDSFSSRCHKPTDAVAKVSVVSNVSAGALIDRLNAHGFELSNEEDADYGVIIADPYDYDFLQNWNRFAITRGKPVLFACTSSSHLEIGPVLFPGQTSCFECLEQRTEAAYRDATLHRRHWIAAKGSGITSPSLALFEALIVAVISRLVQGERVNVLLNEQLSIDVRTFDFRSSPVRRLPRCEACGTLDPIARLRR